MIESHLLAIFHFNFQQITSFSQVTAVIADIVLIILPGLLCLLRKDFHSIQPYFGFSGNIQP